MEQLRPRAACQIVHVDDFHRPRATRYGGDLPEDAKYLRQSIDLDQLADEVLAPIHACGQLRRTMRHLHIETDTYSVERTYDVDRRTIVVVEGVFLLRPPVSRYLHHLVFLEVAEETLIARGTLRDRELHGAAAERKFREKYLPAQRHVFAECPPHQHADVVIDNNDWNHPTVTKWDLP